MDWPWRKKASVPRYVDAVELMNWLDDEIRETVDSDQRMGLKQARDQVGKMDWQR
jgi:hypothetical protein